MKTRITSRKLWLVVGNTVLMVAIPIIFQVFKVPSEVQMLALGAIASTVAFYLGANVLEKKVLGE